MALAAVTGTEGKTTVVEAIRALSESVGLPAVSVGTLGVLDGASRRPLPRCTPSPRLAEALRELEAERTDRVVAVEAYSAALARGDWQGCHPDVAVLTTVGRDHLDVHGSHAAYAAAKHRLFAEIAPTAPAVVLGGSELALTVQASRPPDRCWSLVRSESPGRSAPRLGATLVSRRPLPLGEQVVILLATPAGVSELELSLSVVGSHLAIDVLLSLLAALALGQPLGPLLAAVESVQAPPGRMQPIAGPSDGIGRWVDFAHTPHAVRAAVRTVRERTSGRLVVVLGCGGDRDQGKRPLMGRAASTAADVVVLTDDNPRGEDPAAIRQAIRDGLLPETEVLEVPDRTEALMAAQEQARPGDAVIALGMGPDRPSTPASYAASRRTRPPCDAEVLVRGI